MEGVPTNSSGLSIKLVIFIIIAVVLLNLFIIFACKLYLKRKMRDKLESDSLDDKISSTVTSYMALKDKN